MILRASLFVPCRRGLSLSFSLPWLLLPSTKDGSPFPLVRTFGGRGTAPCKFDFAGGSAQVCFTPWGSNTLLVPEYGNDRVQVRGWPLVIAHDLDGAVDT